MRALLVLLIAATALASHTPPMAPCDADCRSSLGSRTKCQCPAHDCGSLCSYQGCIYATNLIPGRLTPTGIGMTSRRDWHDNVFVAEGFSANRIAEFPEGVQLTWRYSTDFPGKHLNADDDNDECDNTFPRFVEDTTLCTFAGCFVRARQHGGDNGIPKRRSKKGDREDLFVGLSETLPIGGTFGTGRTLPPNEALWAMQAAEARPAIRMTNILAGSRTGIRGRPQYCPNSDPELCQTLLISADGQTTGVAKALCERIFYTNRVSIAKYNDDKRERDGFVASGSFVADDNSIPRNPVSATANVTAAYRLLNCGDNSTFSGCTWEATQIDTGNDAHVAERQILVCAMNGAASRALQLLVATVALAFAISA